MRAILNFDWNGETSRTINPSSFWDVIRSLSVAYELRQFYDLLRSLVGISGLQPERLSPTHFECAMSSNSIISPCLRMQAVGLEPTASSFVARHSILLSYACINLVLRSTSHTLSYRIPFVRVVCVESFELSIPFGHGDLNPMCMPIPPHADSLGTFK